MIASSNSTYFADAWGQRMQRKAAMEVAVFCGFGMDGEDGGASLAVMRRKERRWYQRKAPQTRQTVYVTARVLAHLTEVFDLSAKDAAVFFLDALVSALCSNENILLQLENRELNLQSRHPQTFIISVRSCCSSTSQRRSECCSGIVYDRTYTRA